MDGYRVQSHFLNGYQESEGDRAAEFLGSG